MYSGLVVPSENIVTLDAPVPVILTMTETAGTGVTSQTAGLSRFSRHKMLMWDCDDRGYNHH